MEPNKDKINIYNGPTLPNIPEKAIKTVNTPYEAFTISY